MKEFSFIALFDRLMKKRNGKLKPAVTDGTEKPHE
jgi:hypothetical protein